MLAAKDTTMVLPMGWRGTTKGFVFTFMANFLRRNVETTPAQVSTEWQPLDSDFNGEGGFRCGHVNEDAVGWWGLVAG